MEQEELFHEDWRDAIRHAVKAMGGVEAVGEELWPSLSRKKAGNWLSDCLNPERPAKLDLEEVESLHKLARKHNIHCAAYHFSETTGYERPNPVEPEDEKAKLQRAFVESVRELRKIEERMEQLG
jgi:hypothetical protein